jgi:hypothetical protein
MDPVGDLHSLRPPVLPPPVNLRSVVPWLIFLPAFNKKLKRHGIQSIKIGYYHGFYEKIYENC